MVFEELQNSELADIRHRMRHSAAHIMADIVCNLFPGAILGIGPPTEDGFYYDFDIGRAFTPDDLIAIEEGMKEIISNDIPFVREEISREEALKLFEGKQFKTEIIQGIPEEETISLYRHGSFVDLCEGPHVETTGGVKAVKLLDLAGAYWRGDEKNPMLQRIYGTAFESEDALREYLDTIEKARQRDHRKLGRELELFIFDPIAPASPFFLPKGAVVYNLLVDYVRQLYRSNGYQEVITPQIFSTELWKRSGHYDNYVEYMYLSTVEDREYGVKPMNCPAHALMYASGIRSYRDLPIRYADFGRLHRYERSGVTHGLNRVRTFSQDDAHIFCTAEQVDQEVRRFIDMVMTTYSLFEFTDIRVALSLRPEKRVGDDSMWDHAEGIMEDILKATGLHYNAVAGEGAFYGPKIDFFVADALKREWQLGTVQLDFSLPARFELDYVAANGSQQRPVVIHRAMLGSLERFLGIIIEHYGGALPAWLSPVQIVVVPIADRHVEYAVHVADRFTSEEFRVQVDGRNERMNAKIRDAQMQKIPYMLIVGDEEVSQQSVSIRSRSGGNPGAKSLDQAVELIWGSIENVDL